MKDECRGHSNSSGRDPLRRQNSVNVFRKKILESSKAIVSKRGEFWKSFFFFSTLFAFFGWSGFPILSFHAVEVFEQESQNVI